MKNTHQWIAGILLLTATSATVAKPGDLLTSYGTSGIATAQVAVNVGHEVFFSIRQADGKIVTAGSISSTSDTYLSRFNTNGSVDASFGINGIVTHTASSISSNSIIPTSLLQTSSGKLLISMTDANKVVLAQFNTDGNFDTSFGTNGVVNLITVASNGVRVTDIIQQSDGKLVVIGYVNITERKAFVKRFLSDGSIDATFATDGTLNLTTTSDIINVYAIAQQADGKLVIGGNITTGFSTATQNSILYRINTDGSLDVSFGTNGIVITDVSAGFGDVISHIKIQSDDKILAGGSGQIDGAGIHEAVVMSRYNTDGTLDSSFGTGGIVHSNPVFSSLNAGTSLALQSDEKIVVSNTKDNDFIVQRFTSGGVLDNTFGTNGTAQFDFSGFSSQEKTAQRSLAIVGDVAYVSGKDAFGKVAVIAVKLTDVVNIPLTVSAGGPYTINEGQVLNLQATPTGSTTDTLTYTWDLDNDGQFNDASGQNPAVLFSTLLSLNLATNGSELTIKVSVSSSNESSSSSAILKINNLDPSAAFANAIITEENNVQFNASASSDIVDTLSYAWELNANALFDDATGVQPIILWTQLQALGLGVGTHVVALRVTDSDGATNFAIGTLQINAKPVATDPNDEEDSTQTGGDSGDGAGDGDSSDVGSLNFFVLFFLAIILVTRKNLTIK